MRNFFQCSRLVLYFLVSHPDHLRPLLSWLPFTEEFVRLRALLLPQPLSSFLVTRWGFTAAPLTPTVGGNPNSNAAGDLMGMESWILSSVATRPYLSRWGEEWQLHRHCSTYGGEQPGGVFLVDLNREGNLDIVLGNGTLCFHPAGSRE